MSQLVLVDIKILKSKLESREGTDLPQEWGLSKERAKASSFRDLYRGRHEKVGPNLGQSFLTLIRSNYLIIASSIQRQQRQDSSQCSEHRLGKGRRGLQGDGVTFVLKISALSFAIATIEKFHIFKRKRWNKCNYCRKFNPMAVFKISWVQSMVRKEHLRCRSASTAAGFYRKGAVWSRIGDNGCG